MHFAIAKYSMEASIVSKVKFLSTQTPTSIGLNVEPTCQCFSIKHQRIAKIRDQVTQKFIKQLQYFRRTHKQENLRCCS